MSNADSNPEVGIAGAVNDLTEQTAALVRQEIDSAKSEMVEKVTQWVPAIGLIAVAAGSGVFATASLYRLTTRFAEKVLPPSLAAMVSTAGFGSLAFVSARRATREIRQAPRPVPSETVHTATDRLADTAGRI